MSYTYEAMNQEYDCDDDEFQKRFKRADRTRRVLFFLEGLFLGTFVGVLIAIYILYRLPLTSFGLSVASVGVAIVIASISFLLAWDTSKRADFGWQYTQMRFNYVMKFLKIVHDEISPLKSSQDVVIQKIEGIIATISSELGKEGKKEK